MIKLFLGLLLTLLFSSSYAQVDKELKDSKPHVIEGLYAFEKGDYKRSEKIFRRLLKEHPNNPVFIYNLANIKLVKKQYKEAQKYYQIVIDQKGELAIPAKI